MCWRGLELNEKALDGRRLQDLRGAVKSLLGTRSELLVQFNVSPLRQRGPRKVLVKQPGTPAPAVPKHPEVAAADIE